MSEARTVRLRLPAGKSLSLGGAPCVPDAEGCIAVTEADLAEARRHGLTPAPPAAMRALDAADAATAAASSDAAADMDATDATVKAQKRKGRTA